MGKGRLEVVVCTRWGREPTSRAAALFCVDLTLSSETGTNWGLRWHKLPRERKGVENRPGEQAHKVCGQCALLPEEGKGSRKGQGQVARGQ